MPNSSMSFAPDEPSAILDLERGFLAGIGLGLAAWGALLMITVQSVAAITKSLSRPNYKFLLAYVLVIFSLGTIAVFTHLKWTQSIFIDNRNFPGGPLAYDKMFYSNRVNVAGVACDLITNWLADSLLLYRLFIIFQRRSLVVIFPAMMFLTSFGLSVCFLLTLSKPGASVFTSSVVNFGLLYWSFSISFNVVVTALIVGRVLYMRHYIISVAGISHSRLYFGVSAILIESAALYSISAIVYLVGYSLKSPLQFAVEPVEILQGIASVMIIYRVANGSAYDEHTLSSFSAATSKRDQGGGRRRSIQFASRSTRPTTDDSVTEEQIAMRPSHHLALEKEGGTTFAFSSSSVMVKERYDEDAPPQEHGDLA